MNMYEAPASDRPRRDHPRLPRRGDDQPATLVHRAQLRRLVGRSRRLDRHHPPERPRRRRPARELPILHHLAPRPPRTAPGATSRNRAAPGASLRHPGDLAAPLPLHATSRRHPVPTQCQIKYDACLIRDLSYKQKPWSAGGRSRSTSKCTARSSGRGSALGESENDILRRLLLSPPRQGRHATPPAAAAAPRPPGRAAQPRALDGRDRRAAHSGRQCSSRPIASCCASWPRRTPLPGGVRRGSRTLHGASSPDRPPRFTRVRRIWPSGMPSRSQKAGISTRTCRRRGSPGSRELPRACAGCITARTCAFSTISGRI